MRTLRTAGCLVAGLLLLSLSSFAQTNFAVLTSDGAWTWFNDPRALFNNGNLYFGYVRSSDGSSCLNVFNLQSGQTTNLWVSSRKETDDHDVSGLVVKQDGTMLAIYSRHQTDQFFTCRLSTTTNPVSASAWGPEQTNNTGTTVSTGMTYANPFQLSAENGRVYNFARYLNYNPNVFTSTNGGATWSTPAILIQTGTGSTRPYVKYCSDYNSRIDFLYTDAHPDNYTNSLYHMYYQGGSFYQTDGTFLKSYANLPILHDSGERGTVIYQYSDAFTNDPNQWIPTGRAWCWEIASQTNGAPVCVFQAKVDNVTGTSWSDARIYYYYARWTGTNWQKRFIAQAGRPLYNGQPDYGGGMCLDPLDPNTIYISTDAATPFDLSSTTNATTVALGANYQIWKGVTADGGLTFSWQPITGNSTVDNLRPYIPRRFGGEPCVLWFLGTYTSYTSFSTEIVGLFTTAVPVPVVPTNPPLIFPAMQKANNANNLNLAGSWQDGVVPGAGDIALWDSTVTAANSVALGTNLSWSGIAVTNPGGAVSITSGNTLTLGDSGIDMSAATSSLTISSGLTLGAGNQIWNVTNGQSLTLNTGMFSRSAGATLNLQGSGVISSSMAGLANDSSGSGGIVGPWATIGSGANTSYATLTGGNFASYNNGIAGTYSIPTTVTAATNYVITTAGSVAFGAATRTLNTLLNTAGASTLTWGNSASQINLVANGILNSGTGLLTIAQGGSSSFSGLMIGANNNRELVLNAANAPITISGRVINNSGGASSLIVLASGSNVVSLSGVNTYTGGTTLNAGDLTLANASALGSNSGALTVNGGTLDLGALTTTVGAVAINGGIIQNGTLTGTSFTAGNPNAAVVSAALAGASATLTMHGPGTLTLSGANTYANGTLILGGTLNCNGSLSTGGVTVTGGTLGGTGAIGSAVTIQSGGTLAPGNNSIGALTINNTLTNTGTVFIRINKSGTTLTNSSINGLGAFSIGGTLSVSNIGTGIVTAGDTFKLFFATNYEGAFAAITPATPGIGLAWNTTNLAVDGTLAVIATVPPQFSAITPQNGAITPQGGGFQFTGAGAAGVTYELDAATNLLSPVVWTFITNAVADQSGSFQFADLQATNFPQRFYRIKSGQ
jgi:autotransporter-associated beta strand protein